MPSRAGRNPSIPPSLSPGFPSLSLNGVSADTPDNAPQNSSHAHDASTMAPLNGIMPTASHRRGHHRSISHPFTSPFTAIGKKREKAAPKLNTWDSDSDSDEVTYPLQSLSTSPRKEAKGGTSNQLAEGKCPTCNSTVRWPRHLKVYRCTSCLMVTDLEPEPIKNADNSIDHGGRGTQAQKPPEHEPKPGMYAIPVLFMYCQCYIS